MKLTARARGGCWGRMGPLLVMVATTGVLVPGLAAQEPRRETKKVKASHELLDASAQTDEYGLFVPVPISHPGRRFPADDEFPTGPAIGERLPDFELIDQNGRRIDFHADRNGRRAAVVFQRSAVW